MLEMRGGRGKAVKTLFSFTKKRTQMTGDVAEHNEQHINTPVRMLCLHTHHTAAIVFQDELESNEVGEKAPTDTKSWLPSPKSSQTFNMNTNMPMKILKIYKIIHVVLIQLKSSLALHREFQLHCSGRMCPEILQCWYSQSSLLNTYTKYCSYNQPRKNWHGKKICVLSLRNAGHD